MITDNISNNNKKNVQPPNMCDCQLMVDIVMVIEGIADICLVVEMLENIWQIKTSHQVGQFALCSQALVDCASLPD